MSERELKAVFLDWLNSHGATVFKVARAYTASSDDCQELVQEILLQVWQSLPQFKGESSSLTWSYRISLNTALNWQRSDRRRRKRHQTILEWEDLPANGSDAADRAAQAESVERLYAAIRQLPKSDTALVLLYLDDLSYREIAEIIGISESNVGVKLNRAKKMLTELMNGGSDEH